jgi:hypothetical protein
MLKRLPEAFGFAGRFMGLSTEIAKVEITLINCEFRARVNNGPDITASPFLISLGAATNQDLAILLSGANGGSAVVVITPIQDFPEVDHMLIDPAVPFPINRYRFVTVTEDTLLAAGGQP